MGMWFAFFKTPAHYRTSEVLGFRTFVNKESNMIGLVLGLRLGLVLVLVLATSFINGSVLCKGFEIRGREGATTKAVVFFLCVLLHTFDVSAILSREVDAWQKCMQG